ncbi:MAG: hypothetical protein M0R77_01055 [Gammaproteobacteria bacterium]|nr:hypothetical protein [Acholeplasmataceae bacterium]MCK9529144.1 hypothetical protein [Gammaproteobacteria bacterium]
MRKYSLENLVDLSEGLEVDPVLVQDEELVGTPEEVNGLVEEAVLAENAEEINELSQEGILGFFGGGALGIISYPMGLGGVVGVAQKSAVKNLEAKIEKLTKEIKKIAEDNGREAVKAGKISSEDFDENFKGLSIGAIFSGIILGTLFSPIYNAVKSHQLEERTKEVVRLKKELDSLLNKAVADYKEEQEKIRNSSVED